MRKTLLGEDERVLSASLRPRQTPPSAALFLLTIKGILRIVPRLFPPDSASVSGSLPKRRPPSVGCWTPNDCGGADRGVSSLQRQQRVQSGWQCISGWLDDAPWLDRQVVALSSCSLSLRQGNCSVPRCGQHSRAISPTAAAGCNCSRIRGGGGALGAFTGSLSLQLPPLFAFFLWASLLPSFLPSRMFFLWLPVLCSSLFCRVPFFPSSSLSSPAFVSVFRLRSLTLSRCPTTSSPSAKTDSTEGGKTPEGGKMQRGGRREGAGRTKPPPKCSQNHGSPEEGDTFSYISSSSLFLAELLVHKTAQLRLQAEGRRDAPRGLKPLNMDATAVAFTKSRVPRRSPFSRTINTGSSVLLEVGQSFSFFLVGGGGVVIRRGVTPAPSHGCIFFLLLS